MRNPNGYGTIYKLSGKRRKPWIARKTLGWNDEGKQQYYTIGYFESRAKAMTALAEYNKNPLGERGDITLQKLYDEWSKSKYEKVSPKTVESYSVAWKHLSSLGDERFKNIKKSHIQNVIDVMHDNGLSRSSCHKVKVVAGLLYKYALADDIVDKNYAELIDLPSEEKGTNEIFSDFEIRNIEKSAGNNEWVNTVLILIYTGMRIGELLTLTKFNLDIDNMIITGGIKTDAGKNRVIPIHPKIQNYIRYWYNKEGEYLITKENRMIKKDYYRKYLYYPALEIARVSKLNPHSTRHTFASLLNKGGADKVYIQKLIGHANYSTTADIYTHVDVNELKKAIEKL